MSIGYDWYCSSAQSLKWDWTAGTDTDLQQVFLRTKIRLSHTTHLILMIFQSNQKFGIFTQNCKFAHAALLPSWLLVSNGITEFFPKQLAFCLRKQRRCSRNQQGVAVLYKPTCPLLCLFLFQSPAEAYDPVVYYSGLDIAKEPWFDREGTSENILQPEFLGEM